MTPEKLNQPLPGQFHVPAYVYLTIPLALLAIPLEMTLPRFPGQIGFILMLLPALMAAFEGGFRPALVAGLAGALGLAGAAWFVQWTVHEGWIGFIAAVLPVAWGVALVGCATWLGRCLDIVRQRADVLQSQCDQHERSIYQLYKDSAEIVVSNEREKQRRLQEDAQRVDLSRLLLNIQHLGRELCGNLQMKAVVQLVTEAAAKLLKSPNPRLFIIDEQARELVDHTPGCTGVRLPLDVGMLGWAAKHGQIITAEDISKNHTLANLREQDGTHWHACAPMRFGQKVLGVLGIETVESRGQEFDRLLYIVANFAAVAVNNGRVYEQARESARRDGLTGLFNHATFQSQLAEILSEASEAGGTVSIVLSDVDHFKQFNDRYGHQAGDYVLGSVGELWTRLIPQRAFAARYGGEEFVCVFAETDVDTATQHAEALRFAIENAELEFDGNPLRVTASFGVAAFPVHAKDQAALIREADAAMYKAKRDGRNRVCNAPAQSGDVKPVAPKLETTHTG